MQLALYRGFIASLYVVSFLAIAYLASDGVDYYTTPVLERARHPDFWSLKPGGALGLRYGIVGSALMVMMLLYSVRKRMPGLRRLGGLRFWLDFHIYCGVFGPLLVILHSSFKANGLVALSFYSMILVALSGGGGRFLYSQLPRRQSGDALPRAEVERLSRDLAESLRDKLGLDDDALKRFESITSTRQRGGLIATLFALPWHRLTLRRRLARFRRQLPHDLPRSLIREILPMLRQRAVLEHRLRVWREIHQLFHYWHVLHKPFAVIMYLFMAIHIAVAISTGYGWSTF